MWKQQVLGLLALLVVTGAAAALGGAPEGAPAPAEEWAEPVTLLAAALQGEALSPDGRWELRLEGVRAGVSSGQSLPERVRVYDTETGAAVWEDIGYYTQAVLWSPDGAYAALAREARTYALVTVLETAGWTGWDVTLPDGGTLPEYTFLPEDWGAWREDGALVLTVGRGGDAGEQRTYRCTLAQGEAGLAGTVREETTERLPGAWDFDHDGRPETAERTAVWYPGRTG